MKIDFYPNYPQLAAGVSEYIINFIRENPRSLLCFAGGDTPVPIYRLLVQAVEEKKVDFGECRFVGLDEWVGISPHEQGSCRLLLDQEFFNPLRIQEEKICFFDGDAVDLEQECKKIDLFVDRYGPIDLILLGIGVNGHLGFNEPGSSWKNRAHVVELQPITCEVGQKYFFQTQKLSKGITLGLEQIGQARAAVLVANGPKKASIIKELVACDPHENLPASILKTHPDSHFFIDEQAGSGIAKLTNQG